MCDGIPVIGDSHTLSSSSWDGFSKNPAMFADSVNGCSHDLVWIFIGHKMHLGHNKRNLIVILLSRQERAIQLFDQTKGDFEVTEGVKLVQTDEEPASESRSFNENELSDEPEQREQEVDGLLVDRVARFLGSHTLQFKVSKDAIKDVQRSFDEGNI